MKLWTQRPLTTPYYTKYHTQPTQTSQAPSLARRESKSRPRRQRQQRKFLGLGTLNIRQSTDSTVLQGVNTITLDLPLQSSHQAPPLPQATHGPTEPRQPAKKFNTQQVFDDEAGVPEELAQLQQEYELTTSLVGANADPPNTNESDKHITINNHCHIHNNQSHYEQTYLTFLFHKL
jgi:hypothetical protein